VTKREKAIVRFLKHLRANRDEDIAKAVMAIPEYRVKVDKVDELEAEICARLNSEDQKLVHDLEDACIEGSVYDSDEYYLQGLRDGIEIARLHPPYDLTTAEILQQKAEPVKDLLKAAVAEGIFNEEEDKEEGAFAG